MVLQLHTTSRPDLQIAISPSDRVARTDLRKLQWVVIYLRESEHEPAESPSTIASDDAELSWEDAEWQ